MLEVKLNQVSQWGFDPIPNSQFPIPPFFSKLIKERLKIN
jgi:hypothetical protein